MRQPRTLSPSESLLRNPDGGAANLAAAPDTWFELTPRGKDERYDISMLGFTIAGPGLLSNLDRFGRALGQIQFASEVLDESGVLLDTLSLVRETISSESDWSRGIHAGTLADREVDSRGEGSRRARLRGNPAPAGSNPSAAQWTSPAFDLSYGSEIVAASWECGGLRDASASTTAAPAIELLTGKRRDGVSADWDPPRTIVSSSSAIERGYAELAPPAIGELYRWRIRLPYVDPGGSSRTGESAPRTATFYSLGAWIRLARPRWHFSSLAELLARGEAGPILSPGGWKDGTEDLLLLRVPFSIHLHGRSKEKLKARLTGGGLSYLTIHPDVDLRFEAV